jgi:hypothetical protein
VCYYRVKDIRAGSRVNNTALPASVRQFFQRRLTAERMASLFLFSFLTALLAPAARAGLLAAIEQADNYGRSNFHPSFRPLLGA